MTNKKSNAENEIGVGTSKKINQLSGLDIEALGDQLRGSTNPIDRRLAFSKLLEGLTAENALLIRDQIKNFDPNSAEFKEFHYAWGVVGGTDAIMFGVDTVEPDMQPALSGWASSDPQKAIEWFEALDMENDSSFDPLLKDRKMKAEDLRNHAENLPAALCLQRRIPTRVRRSREANSIRRTRRLRRERSV